MASGTNRQLYLAVRPGATERPSQSTWQVREAAVPEPSPGQVLVHNLYVSVDPAMRGWIRPTPTYIEPVQIGDVMRAGTVGCIVASRHPGFREGDYVSDVAGSLGFQDYALGDGAGLLKLDRSAASLPSYAGGLGLNGLTAYFGLLEVGKLQPGENVLVSSAAGATGSAAGQIAKIRGCRVVGIAGGPDKCRYVGEVLGFDETIDYKEADLPEAVKAALPRGLDVFFDTVGGGTLDAALLQLNRYGRVVVCGTMSQVGPRGESVRGHLRLALVHGRMEGFIAYEYASRFRQALGDLLTWYSTGRLRLKEEIVDGFDSLPYCLNRVFAGGNFGKTVIRINPE